MEDDLTDKIKHHILKALTWYKVEHGDQLWFSREEDLANNEIAEEWMKKQETNDGN